MKLSRLLAFAAALALVPALTAQTTTTVVASPSDMTWFKGRTADTLTVGSGTVTATTGSTSGSTFVANFTPVTLAIGETMTVNVTFTMGATVNSGASNSFRWGVFDNGGTPILADYNTNTPVVDTVGLYLDDRGYFFDYNINGTSSLALRGRNTFVNNQLLSSTGDYTSLTSTITGTSAALAANTTYTLTLTLLRTDDGYDITGLINGGAVDNYQRFAEDSTTASRTVATFNEFAFYINGGTNGASGLTINSLTITKTTPPASAPPSITSQPAAQTVNAGTGATFSVSADGTAPLTYQWRRNGVDLANDPGHIAGVTTSTLTLTNVTLLDAGDYTVVVTNDFGTATSNIAVLTVNAATPPSITTPPASQTVTAGSSATFTVVADGTAPLAYQWRRNGVDINGATGTSYSIPVTQVSDAGDYTVVVTNAGGTATSAVAVLTVNVPAVPPAAPVAAAGTAIGATSFTANWAASADAAGYRLDVATDAGFSQMVAGFNNRDVGLALSRHVTGLSASTTYHYRVRAVNGAGSSGNSNVISVTTTPQFTASETVIDVSESIWIKHRSIDTVEPNTGAKTVTFNQLGTSSSLYVGNLTSSFTVAVGQTLTMSLTFTTGSHVESGANNSFRLGLYNSGGTRPTVNTNAGDSSATYANDRGYLFNYNFNGANAGLHGRRGNPDSDNNLMGTTTDLYSLSLVDPLRTGGTNAPFAPNTTYTLTATISRLADRTVVTANLNGGAISNYFVSGDDTSSGSFTNDTYDQFAMRINAGGVALNAITFSDMRFSLAAYQQPTAPVITSHPSAQTVFAGQNVSFTVAASGSGALTYQWKKDGVDLVNGGRISGANSATLQITGALGSDTGTYTVTVTDTLGSDLSDPALLTVNAAIAPSISTPPSNATVNEGQPVNFTVVATGTAPLTYQWSFGLTPLSDNARFTGTATSTLTVVSADPLEAGTYSVTVSNSAGSTSASATLTVNVAGSPPPAPVATAATSVTNTQFTANWSSSTGATGYLLDVSTDPSFGSFLPGYNALSVGGTSYIVTGLTDGTTYYYRVAAFNSAGTSGLSGTISTLAILTESPVITTPAFALFTSGLPGSFQLRAVGSPNPTFEGSGLPAWLSLNTSTGLLSGTPPAGTGNVNLTFTVTARNGIPHDAVQSFTLGIVPIPEITGALAVTTLAGTAGQAGSADGSGASARFRFPLGLVGDASGNLYLADTDNHVIRRITNAGVVTTLAGTAGQSGSVNGTGSAARFSSPSALAIDGSGNLYVADTLNHLIRRVTPAGVVTTVAGLGGTSGATDAIGGDARFNAPQGIAVDAAGTTLYVADTNNHTIRRIVLASGAVTTFAGSAGNPGSANGIGSAARFNAPAGLVIASNGTLYVADMDNHTIRTVTSAALVSTLAGSAGGAAAADGVAGGARFNQPSSVVLNAAGTQLYVTDSDSHTIRRIILPAGTVTTAAGLAGTSGSADGAGSVARFKGPAGIAFASTGDLVIADTENHTLRLGRLPVGIVITTQPQSQVVSAGGSATFTVAATGTPTPTYQWFFAGSPISGATSNTLTVSNAQQTTNAGNYYVVVSNTLGSVTSATVTLTVPVSSTTPTVGREGAAGGGGGAPSLWFLAALALAAGLRRATSRR